MSKLSQYIESLIFVADSPITVKDIKESLLTSIKLKVSNDEVLKTVTSLQEKFSNETHSFELVGISNGYQFMTKAAYHDVVGTYLRIQSKKKLSRAAMETLAIIAYKQPITKSGIESIRGVNCDYAVQKLVEKELIEILGRADTPGRPILYGTSDKFMDYFGIKDITDLPKLKEIIVSESSIGMEEGLVKMHNEGLTEDFKFLPSEEIEVSETIETTTPNSVNAEENDSKYNAQLANEEKGHVDKEIIQESNQDSIMEEHTDNLQNQTMLNNLGEKMAMEDSDSHTNALSYDNEAENIDSEKIYSGEENNLEQENRNEEPDESVNSEIN